LALRQIHGRYAAYLNARALVHCGFPDRHGLLDLTLWRESWTISSWRAFLAATGGGGRRGDPQERAYGPPLGDAEFVRGLERALCRPLAPKKGGRPPKQIEDSRQAPLAFVPLE